MSELTNEIPVTVDLHEPSDPFDKPELRGAALSNTALLNQQHLTTGGVDSFSLMFFLLPSSSSSSPSSMVKIVEELETIKAIAQERKKSVFHKMRGHVLEVQGTGEGKAGPYFSVVFNWEGLRIAVSKSDPDKAANFYVTAQGACMLAHQFNAWEVYDKVKSLITDLGLEVQKETITRLDLQCDIIGQHVSAFVEYYEKRSYVCRGGRFARVFESHEAQEIIEKVDEAYAVNEAEAVRILKEEYKKGYDRGRASLQELLNAKTLDVVRFGTGKNAQTVEFGKKTIKLRIYDKQAELKSQHPERLQTMLDIWGCSAKTPVTRVEFQMRSDALRSRGITTFVDAMESLGTLANYLVEKWCVIREDLDRRATKRSPIASLWNWVQHCFQLVFTEGFKPLKRRYVSPRMDDASQLIKQAAGCLREAVGRVYGLRDNTQDFLNACSQLMFEGFGGTAATMEENLFRHWEQTERWNNRVVVHNRKITNPQNWMLIDKTLSTMLGQNQAVRESIDPRRVGLVLN